MTFLYTGVTLHKSLITLNEVLKKLSTPTKAAVAPFRASKLTHYLNELLGGNAIVVGLGILASGEPAVSRKVKRSLRLVLYMRAMWSYILHCVYFVQLRRFFEFVW